MCIRDSNMTLRIAYCGVFIHRFYVYLFAGSELKSKSFLSNFHTFRKVSLIGLVIGGIDWYFIGFVKSFQQLAINIVLAVLLLGTVLYKENKLILELLASRNLNN